MQTTNDDDWHTDCVVPVSNRHPYVCNQQIKKRKKTLLCPSSLCLNGSDTAGLSCIFFFLSLFSDCYQFTNRCATAGISHHQYNIENTFYHLVMIIELTIKWSIRWTRNLFLFLGNLRLILWNVSAKIDSLHQLSFPWLPYVYVDFNWLINKSCSKRPKCLISSLPFVHTFFSRAEQPRLVKRSSGSSINSNNIHTHILSLLGDERPKK